MASIEDYTVDPLAKEGIYRAFPVSWTVEDSSRKEGSTSKSVAIAFRFAIVQEWDPQAKMWSTAWPPGYYTEGRAWVVGKDGSMNAPAISNLAKCGLWNGDWDALAGPPPQVYVHVDVQSETWEGKARIRAAWINPNTDEPTARGAFVPANPELLTSLRARFGGQTRAIAGGAPQGAPPAPPPRPAAVQAPHAGPIVGMPPAMNHSAPAPAVATNIAPPPLPPPIAQRARPAIAPAPIQPGQPGGIFTHPPPAAAGGGPDDPLDPDAVPF